MPETQPTVELNKGFSEPDAVAPSWAEVAGVLSKSEMFWLSTVRRDGRPHVTPLPAIWLDGALYFCTGSGDFQATDEGFGDPDRGPGVVFVFAVTPAKVLAFGKSPYTQTRYSFPA